MASIFDDPRFQQYQQRLSIKAQGGVRVLGGIAVPPREFMDCVAIGCGRTFAMNAGYALLGVTGRRTAKPSEPLDANDPYKPEPTGLSLRRELPISTRGGHDRSAARGRTAR